MVSRRERSKQESDESDEEWKWELLLFCCCEKEIKIVTTLTTNSIQCMKFEVGWIQVKPSQAKRYLKMHTTKTSRNKKHTADQRAANVPFFSLLFLPKCPLFLFLVLSPFLRIIVDILSGLR